MSDDYTTPQQRASYGIGRQVGQQIREQLFKDFDAEAIATGIKDLLTGAEAKVNAADFQTALAEIESVMQAERLEEAKSSLAEGQQFLDENAKRAEVTVLPSGLQYEVLQEGSGDTPTANSVVKTHYHGTLINGEVFDSSVERGEPAEFPVNRVIAGWTEALQLMPVGTKWRLFVPSNLAYGDQGAGGKIGPHATLIFDVELLDIVS